MLGTSSFDEAVERGLSQFREHEEELLADDDGDDDPRYAVIEIEPARQLGIMPIREP